jgi:hypothetical protein
MRGMEFLLTEAALIPPASGVEQPAAADCAWLTATGAGMRAPDSCDLAAVRNG